MQLVRVLLRSAFGLAAVVVGVPQAPAFVRRNPQVHRRSTRQTLLTRLTGAGASNEVSKGTAYGTHHRGRAQNPMPIPVIACPTSRASAAARG